MNVSKFLISSASALGLVATIGFAVAQTSTPSSDAITNPTAADAAATMPTAPMPADTSVAPASPMVSPETNMTTEREPQADRN